MIISTKSICNAINFYENQGFKHLDVPYLVDPDVTQQTHKGRTYRHLGLDYVGSAEQSFLQLIKNKEMCNGLFMALTPCRRADEPDETHLEVFLKLELIIIPPANNEIDIKKHLADIIGWCTEYFENELTSTVDLVKTNEGFDLESCGVELGSYGIREYKGVEYVYGTGVAEPRLSFIRGMSG